MICQSYSLISIDKNNESINALTIIQSNQIEQNLPQDSRVILSTDRIFDENSVSKIMDPGFEMSLEKTNLNLISIDKNNEPNNALTIIPSNQMIYLYIYPSRQRYFNSPQITKTLMKMTK